MLFQPVLREPFFSWYQDFQTLMEMNMTEIEGWFGKKLLTWNSYVVITFYHLLQIILPKKRNCQQQQQQQQQKKKQRHLGDLS